MTADEPMSTPDSGGLREAVEALAGEWLGRYERLFAGRELAELLAAHPGHEPVPTLDSADAEHVATDPLCVEFDKARGIVCQACAEDRDDAPTVT